MNKDLKDQAIKLNQWILEQDVVKEYKKYETLIKKDAYLNNLEKELKSLQQQIVILKHQDVDCYDIVEEYHKKKLLFDENPIVHNYLILKEEVNDLISQIEKDIIQQLTKNVDS